MKKANVVHGHRIAAQQYLGEAIPVSPGASLFSDTFIADEDRVDRVNATGQEMLTAEASELGLPPGHFPSKIQLSRSGIIFTKVESDPGKSTYVGPGAQFDLPGRLIVFNT